MVKTHSLLNDFISPQPILDSIKRVCICLTVYICLTFITAAILSRTSFIEIVANTTTINPPTSPYSPKSTCPSASSTQRAVNSPHTNAYSDRPYVAIMFKNIRRLGVMGRKVGEFRVGERWSLVSCFALRVRVILFYSLIYSIIKTSQPKTSRIHPRTPT